MRRIGFGGAVSTAPVDESSRAASLPPPTPAPTTRPTDGARRGRSRRRHRGAPRAVRRRASAGSPSSGGAGAGLPLQVAGQQVRGRDGVLRRARLARLAGQRGREALVEALDREVGGRRAARSTKRSVSSAWSAALAAQGHREPDDDPLDPLCRASSTIRASPSSECRALDDLERARDGARSGRTRQRRSARSRSRVRAPSPRSDCRGQRLPAAERVHEGLLGLRERLAELLRILASGAGHRRPAAAAPADERGRPTDDLRRRRCPAPRASGRG